MTENADGHSRGPGKGGGGAGGGRGGHQQDGIGSGGGNGGGSGGGSGFIQQQQQQDFSSWRNPLAAAAAAGGPGMSPADAAYNNFYYSGGYSPFSAGDMRDSIAAIWSRTSPSGEGVAAAFTGGYGQFPDSSPGTFAANSNPAGQFAANLTGHFAAATNDLGMFSAGGEYSAAYGQQYGYGGQQYTQWGEGGRNNGAGSAPYSYLGGQGGEGRGGDRAVVEAQQSMEGMRLGGASANRKGESNGYQGGGPEEEEEAAGDSPRRCPGPTWLRNPPNPQRRLPRQRSRACYPLRPSSPHPTSPRRCLPLRPGPRRRQRQRRHHLRCRAATHRRHLHRQSCPPPCPTTSQ